jgi:hypothetical protein
MPAIRASLRQPFELTTPAPARRVADAVDRRLRAPGCPFRGLATPSQIELYLREGERRFFSPQLTVLVHEDEGRTVLRGRFGPNPSVWTMFVAFYAMVIISALGGVFFGFAQLLMGEPAWGLLSIPVGLLLVGVIYIAAGVGQRLGHHQVDVIRDFLTDAIAADLDEFLSTTA